MCVCVYMYVCLRVCVCVCVCVRARPRAYWVPGLGSCISGTFVFTLMTQVLRTHTRASEALCLDVKNRAIRELPSAPNYSRVPQTSQPVRNSVFLHYVVVARSRACQHMVFGVPANRHVNIILGVLAYHQVNIWS